MMLKNAKERVYIMASFDIIKEFESEIKSFSVFMTKYKKVLSVERLASEVL